MLKQLQNIKSITYNIDELIDILRSIKRTQKKVTFNTDYNKKTLYIKGKNILYQIEGT